VRLRVDKALKQIYDVVVFDKNGSKYTYSIQNLVSNIKIAPKTFIFDKVNYPDLEVVDLR
jgi:outer membrane lipoprotein-sorting protein